MSTRLRTVTIEIETIDGTWCGACRYGERTATSDTECSLFSAYAPHGDIVMTWDNEAREHRRCEACKGAEVGR